MESWESDFISGQQLIQRTTIWLRLPGLPLEFWISSTILAIVSEAGQTLDIDDFADNRKKTGCARVRVQIDAGKPLLLGILIERRKGTFWQQFVYENLPSMCYRCERMGHLDNGCRFSDDDPSSVKGRCPLNPDNLVAMETEEMTDGPCPLMAEGNKPVGGS